MSCEDCLLCVKRTQIVMPTPCCVGGLLAIGEAPGAEEDVAGEGFVGRAGRTLDKLLAAHGIGRGGYGRANVCWCRPVDDGGKNRKPTEQEISACLPKLAKVIGECRPSVILCVGWSSGRLFCSSRSLYDAVKTGSFQYFPGQQNASALKHLVSPCRVVVMPHTSPLVFNRNSPDGRKWADIAREQVSVAVSLIDGRRA